MDDFRRDDLPSSSSSGNNELLVKTKLFDIDNNIAAALAYVPLVGANIIFSIVWLVTEPKSNRYLRHHAIQSLVLNVGFGWNTYRSCFCSHLHLV